MDQNFDVNRIISKQKDNKLKSVKKIIKQLTIIKEDKGAMVFDKSRGIYFQVNYVGMLIINFLENDKSVEEIISELSIKCHMDINDVKEDVDNFIKMLKELKLI